MNPEVKRIMDERGVTRQRAHQILKRMGQGPQQRKRKYRAGMSKSEFLEAAINRRMRWLMVSEAVKFGVIEKLACIVCGSPKSQGHHEDYEKPLDVVWLCQRHHSSRHKYISMSFEAWLRLVRQEAANT